MKETLILLIIEAVILGGGAFVLSRAYANLSALEDVKWYKSAAVRSRAGGDQVREVIKIFPFGDKPIKNVSVSVQIDEELNLEIENCQIERYDKSVFDFAMSPTKVPDGQPIFFEEPELQNRKKVRGFNVKELNPQRGYEFTCDIKAPPNAESSAVDRFKKPYLRIDIRDAEKQYPPQNLTLTDNVRLHMNAMTLLGIALLIGLMAAVWYIGSRFLSAKQPAVTAPNTNAAPENADNNSKPENANKNVKEEEKS